MCYLESHQKNVIAVARSQTHLCFKDPDPKEEPIRHGEQECEGGEEGTVHTHSGQACPARLEKQGPHGHQEDEELEGEGEEEALTGCATSLQPVRPHKNRKKQEGQGRGQHQQPHQRANSQGKITAEIFSPVVQSLPQSNHFLLGNTQL